MSQIKAAFKCSEEDRAKFKDSRCLLTISVGQEAHEGEKFAATIDLINRSFKSCIILVDDTLQRHTLAIGSEQSSDYFYEKTLVLGDRWINENKQYYESLSVVEKVIRWNYWLTCKDYLNAKEKVTSLLTVEEEYKQIFQDSIEQFLFRYSKRLENPHTFDKKKAELLCLDYLTEECAMIVLSNSLKAQFELYAGQHNQAILETYKRFVWLENPSFLHLVPIVFANKQFKPLFSGKSLE
jgi:hypothetical protein